MAALDSKPMEKKSRWLWFCAICLIVIVIDQWMKQYALANWKGLPPRSFLNDLFRIQYAPNPGAFLGMFGNLSRDARFLILTILNGVILVGVSGYILFGKKVSKYIFIAFALVVAGGIGNMIDRIRYEFVIDFFNIGIGGLRSGIFNIADMAISAGFLMMLPLAIWGEADSKNESGNSSGPEPASTETAPS